MCTFRSISDLLQHFLEIKRNWNKLFANTVFLKNASMLRNCQDKNEMVQILNKMVQLKILRFRNMLISTGTQKAAKFALIAHLCFLQCVPLSLSLQEVQDLESRA